MAKYRDFIMNQSSFNKAEEYTDNSAVVLAIRNILLTRRGNFPFNPSLGMNIEKYQFDLLDQQQIDTIRNELSQQISKYIPDISGVYINIEIVKDEEGIVNSGKNMLGITISSKVASDPLSINFLLYEKNGELNIFNETN
jgi:phage baseplate assembly protein W